MEAEKIYVKFLGISLTKNELNQTGLPRNKHNQKHNQIQEKCS